MTHDGLLVVPVIAPVVAPVVVTPGDPPVVVPGDAVVGGRETRVVIKRG